MAEQRHTSGNPDQSAGRLDRPSRFGKGLRGDERRSHGWFSAKNARRLHPMQQPLFTLGITAMTTKEKHVETPTPPAAGIFGATVPPKFKREVSPLATKSANDAARAKR